MTSEPEEIRTTEKQMREGAAMAAEIMLKKPWTRWFMRPLHRYLKWVATKCDEVLRDEGWR